MFEDAHWDEIFLTRISSIFEIWFLFNSIMRNISINNNQREILFYHCCVKHYYTLHYTIHIFIQWCQTLGWLRGVRAVVSEPWCECKSNLFWLWWHTADCWVCIEWNNYNYQQVTIMSLRVFICQSARAIMNISLSAPTSFFILKLIGSILKSTSPSAGPLHGNYFNHFGSSYTRVKVSNN